MLLSCHVEGEKIKIQAEPLGDGWDISLYGGKNAHVGAVSIAQPDGEVHTMTLPGHWEGQATEPWAVQLANFLKGPVCFRCGICYDHMTQDLAQAIVSQCDTMVSDVARVLYLKKQNNGGFREK